MGYQLKIGDLEFKKTPNINKICDMAKYLI